MRVVAILVVAMALVAGIVPQFTYCKTQSTSSDPTMTMSSSTAASGTSSAMTTGTAATPAAPMPCYWTARAALGVAPPLLLAGVLLFFARRKETRRALAVLIALLGLVVILLPTVLIGVSAQASAVCNTVMRPAMVAAGGLALALGLIALLTNELRPERQPVAGQPAS